MKPLENTAILFQTLEPKLSAEDDPAFWRSALLVLADELAQRQADEPPRGERAMVVGVCSRWVRPHNSLWNAAGGFVCPSGYESYTPEFDWSETFVLRDGRLEHAKKLPGKKVEVFRVAAPARTARHKQAVVNTRWSPEGMPVFYGFRKIAGKWLCVAASDEKSRGPVNVTS
jgi:hypothetical protein